MPFTLLSHQAPALPLKLWRPALFSGTALALGSMAPDLEYFFLDAPDPVHGHTLLGQLYFCLPLTILLVLLVRWIARPVAAQVPDCGPLHLRDYGALSRATMTRADFIRVSLSALIGSFSHIFIDAFTHQNGRALSYFPSLMTPVINVTGRVQPLYRVLQFGGSALFALATLAMLAHIGRRRLILRWYGIAASDAAPAAAPSPLFWGIALTIAAVGGVARLAHDFQPAYASSAVFWGHEILQVACFFFIGLCAATVAVRLREGAQRSDGRARVRA